MKKNNTLFGSFRYAFSGLKHMFLKERNFKIELYIGMLALIACAFFQVSRLEWILVLLCCMIVLPLECINSALEKAVDLESPDYHPLAKIAKDFAAGGVLLASIGSAVIGLLIFYPYIKPYLSLLL